MERDLGRDIDEFADHARRMETQDIVDSLRQEYHDLADFLHPSSQIFGVKPPYAPSFVRLPSVLLRDMTANPVPLGNRTASPSLFIIDGKFTSKSPYSTSIFTSCLFPGKSFGTTFYGRSAT
jgi:hypothetical protein